ncbi:MAG: ATP-binding protein [Methyloligellaceae bacterium]
MKKITHHILIIDDSEDDRLLYRRLLQKDDETDWQIVEADNGGDGLDICRSMQISCVLLDYSLPGRDGIGVLEEMKSLPYKVPVVMLTGQGSEVIAVQALQEGAQDYLNKNNLSPEAIQRAVHNAIEVVSFKAKIQEQQTELHSFANVLAHDLKEPARSIGLLLKYLKDDIADKLEGKSDRYMTMISDASDRMIQLIDSVSSYTFLDKAKVEHEEFPLDLAVEDAKSNLEAVLREKNAIVIYDNLPDVFGDKWQITQLLQNLIGNGIKYCRSETPSIQISAAEEDENYIIRVKDNGIGMKEEDLKQIFVAFKRLHTNQEFDGTGLGLATCKKIVDRHGGEIWCESVEGQGSTFIFSLPKVEVQEQTVQQSA